MIRPIGGNVLEKRVPKNPKYANVRPTINSGPNVLKQSGKLDEAKLNARFHKEEFFKRLKPSAFSRLASEGKIDFLLLDVRDDEAFQKCHIQGAKSYPAPYLTRSVNAITSDILAYVRFNFDSQNSEAYSLAISYSSAETKCFSQGLVMKDMKVLLQMNKEPERIIVIYDEDERIAAPAGNLFYEKGVDNVYLVSGGLRELGSRYPELVEGELPAPLSPVTSLARSSRSHLTSSASSFAPSMRSSTTSFKRTSAGDTASVAGSLRSSVGDASVARRSSTGALGKGSTVSTKTWR